MKKTKKEKLILSKKKLGIQSKSVATFESKSIFGWVLRKREVLD